MAQKNYSLLSKQVAGVVSWKRVKLFNCHDKIKKTCLCNIRIKKTTQKWEKISTHVMYISSKGLISKIQKEFLNSTAKIKHPDSKTGTKLEMFLCGLQMANNVYENIHIASLN